MEPEQLELRGDFLITLTSDQWNQIRPKVQTIIETLVAVGVRKLTILIANDDQNCSLRTFRNYVADVDKWEGDGLLIMEVREHFAYLQLFVPLFPTIEAASQAGLIDATGLLTGHQN